ncbi:MAG: hypothetical protein M1829_005232 [Trizodia sp. TS-e1964]|nr:MAG: hypothetical protein M1829_005232 [Trizodia sp. TS-e1964]
MSDTPLFYLLKPERVEDASTAHSWLGRIVQNYAAPDACFTPTEPSQLLANFPVSETTITNASIFQRGTTNNDLGFQLTKLASLFERSGTTSKIEFSSTSIRYLRFVNHAKAFKALQQDAEVKADLSEILTPGGAPAYFIVGMLIWEDATFVDGQGGSSARGGSVELPIAQAVAASTAVMLPDINPKVTAGGSMQLDRGVAGFSKGARIFAFEYRAVSRRFYALSRNFSPLLGGYGARMEKGRLFSPAKPTEAEVEVELEMDEEDVTWPDLIDNGPEVEELTGLLTLAFGEPSETA